MQLALPERPLDYDAESGPQAVFAQNGSAVITGSVDGWIQIRDTKTLAQIGPSLRHPLGIDFLVTSPDGRLLLSGGRDKTARLWNVETHQQVGDAFVHDGTVTSACFSPDGSLIVTGSADGKARLWDVKSQGAVGVSFQHSSGVNKVSFNGDGSQVVTTNRQGFHLWNTYTGKPVREVIPYNAVVFSLQYTPVQKLFVFGSQDQTVQIWDATTYEPVGSGFAHPEPVHAVAFSPDGSEILTGCRDGKARRWELQTGRLVGSPMQHTLSVCSVDFSPDGSHILTASINRTVRLWKIPRPGRHGPLRHEGMIRGVGFSPDGKHAVAASSDGVVQEWDVASLKPLGNPIRVSPYAAYSATYSPDGSRIAVGHSGGIEQWDRHSRRKVGPALEPSVSVVDISYSPDGTLLLAAGGGKTNAWSITDGIRVLSDKDAVAAAFNHDGSLVVGSLYRDASASNPAVHIWESTGGVEKRHLPPDNTFPWAVAFRPDGRQFLTGGGDGLLRIWDTETGELVRQCPQHHESSIRRAVFTPDGKCIVTASHDRTARVWDVATGRPIGPPLTHSGPVKAVAISPDGKLIATGDGDGAAWIWDFPPPPIDPEIDVEMIRLWVEVVTGMELHGNQVRPLDVPGWSERASRLRNAKVFPSDNRY